MLGEVEHWTYEVESPFLAPHELLNLTEESEFEDASERAAQGAAFELEDTFFATVDRAAEDELMDDEASIYESALRSPSASFETEAAWAPEAEAPTLTPGSPIPIPVPPACVQVPTLAAPDRPCAGVDTTRFASIAEVAAFAGQVADCYANRMAARQQQERLASAQKEAERRARSASHGGSSRQPAIAAGRAAVQPEPLDAVRADIRAKYLKFLEDEYRDTISGAGNRWGRRCMLNDVSRQWMFGVREQLDFITFGTNGRSLGRFGPPPPPAGGDRLVEIEPPAITDGGARVQPVMNTFLRELRARAPRHSAWHYPNHGGAAFNGRGYSIDLGLREEKDSRGFYTRPAAVTFLLAIDAAARAAGVEWRAIYNDYAVAAAINRHLDRKRVVFVGHPRRGGRRIGLNWHGPLILHFHVDITPSAQAPTTASEDFQSEGADQPDELLFEDADLEDMGFSSTELDATQFEPAAFDGAELQQPMLGEWELETSVGEEVDRLDQFEDLGDPENFGYEDSAHEEIDAGGEAGEEALAGFGELLLESAVGYHGGEQLGEESDFGGEDLAGEELGEDELGPLANEWEIADASGEPRMEQFEGSEHKAIGDKGSGGAQTALARAAAASTPLTFGDVVALAGDMYASYWDLDERSRTPAGRAELAWALWYALKMPNAPEPYLADPLKKEVLDRYYRLAAGNISHFSAGGKACYIEWHAKAMRAALSAGQTRDDRQWRIAVGMEAFSDHYLTDIFSAGHVRTPRAEIKEWYKQHGLGSSTPFVNYMAAFMLSRLRDRNPWLNIPIVGGIALGVLQTRVRDLGGEALQSFSLGDIVSLALHDRDNDVGLDVVSKVDATGRRQANGYRWRAIGDAHLLRAQGEATSPKPQMAAARLQTRQMVTAAVAVSFRDLVRVRDAGRRIGKRNLPGPTAAQVINQALKGSRFPALDYVPTEDTTKSKPNDLADLDWRWGRLGTVAYAAVDKAVKRRITKELAAKIKTVDDPAPGPAGSKIHGTREAFQAFVKHLGDEGIRALQEAVGKPAR
jgi:hypothetical protein